MAAELRAVLLFHGNVSRVLWHPTIRETMLIACDGDAYDPLVFVWDPLSEGPKSVDFSGQLSNGKVHATWLCLDVVEPGALFASDGREYLLASLANDEDDSVPWSVGSDPTYLLDNTEDFEAFDEEASQVDDTFCFKKT